MARLTSISVKAKSVKSKRLGCRFQPRAIETYRGRGGQQDAADTIAKAFRRGGFGARQRGSDTPALPLPVNGQIGQVAAITKSVTERATPTSSTPLARAVTIMSAAPALYRYA